MNSQAAPVQWVRHAPGYACTESHLSVEAAEAVLSDWFEAPVVLTSSGRGAILLCLRHFGLNRYRNTIALPKMISACVLDALIRHGFPVDAASGQPAEMTLLYHQYGFTQAIRPDGLVLEDICHSFFADAHSGARQWAGPVAVFSLPKFFKTRDMAGGIVVADPDLAARLREMRDAAGAGNPADMSQLSGPDLEHVYLDRLLRPGITARQLGGMPTSLAYIRTAGARRRAIMDIFLDAARNLPMPEGWRGLLGSTLPFVFPVFGPADNLRSLERDLRDISVETGMYRIDIARNMMSPQMHSVLLVPCHDHMEETVCIKVAELILRRSDFSFPAPLVCA